MLNKRASQALPERFRARIRSAGESLDLVASGSQPLLQRRRQRRIRLTPNGNSQSQHRLKLSPMLGIGAQDLFDADASAKLFQGIVKQLGQIWTHDQSPAGASQGVDGSSLRGADISPSSSSCDLRHKRPCSISNGGEE